MMRPPMHFNTKSQGLARVEKGKLTFTPVSELTALAVPTSIDPKLEFKCQKKPRDHGIGWGVYLKRLLIKHRTIQRIWAVLP